MQLVRISHIQTKC